MKPSKCSLDISVAEALYTQQFLVIGWGNLSESFLSATRISNFADSVCLK